MKYGKKSLLLPYGTVRRALSRAVATIRLRTRYTYTAEHLRVLIPVSYPYGYPSNHHRRHDKAATRRMGTYPLRTPVCDFLSVLHHARRTARLTLLARSSRQLAPVKVRKRSAQTQ
eukprot:scaffold411982_cov31-Prasinocladus_malaysianus.AAC.1